LLRGSQGHWSWKDFMVNGKLGAAGRNLDLLLHPRKKLMKNLVEK